MDVLIQPCLLWGRVETVQWILYCTGQPLLQWTARRPVHVCIQTNGQKAKHIPTSPLILPFPAINILSCKHFFYPLGNVSFVKKRSSVERLQDKNHCLKNLGNLIWYPNQSLYPMKPWIILPSISENNAENNLTELRDKVHNASLYFIDYNFLSYRN